MQRFRRKEAEVEAMQFNSKSLDRPPHVHGSGDGRWFVTIHDSDIEVLDGDWVYYSAEGIGVCRNTFFRDMYEPIE